MRRSVLSNRIALVSRVSSIALLGGLAVGCSSGFQRFDTSIYETAVPQQTTQATNVYPEGLDGTTTASIKRVSPPADVAPSYIARGGLHSAEPTYVAPQAQPSGVYQPQPYEPYIAPEAQPYASQSLGQSNAIVRKPLDEIGYETPDVASQQTVSYAPPTKNYKPEPVYIPETPKDKIETASIDARPASTSRDGWSSAGGTKVSVREGETLYNLSKRYGVPVSAIRKANAMQSDTSLKAGQQILIPNYVFSRTSTVSAPDNNAKTRAARATTGNIGDDKSAVIHKPVKRPVNNSTASSKEGGNNPKRYEISERLEAANKPRLPEVASDAPLYTVQAGDSLSKIAARNGTTVAALKQVNGIAGNGIRIGQKLKLSGSVDNVTTASVEKYPVSPAIDPITTSSRKQPLSVDTKSKAPERTGISDFRWPVKGRVVSSFGQAVAGGNNEGIDISVPEGTAVHAAENGVVIYVGEEIPSYGKLILVRHTDDWVSAYAHNRDYEVKKGDTVRRGQVIARSGRTGSAGRPKLHFELRKASTPVDPKKYLAG